MDLAYRAQLVATGGLDPSYTWALAIGDLPSGLTLSADGTISGTPTRGPAPTRSRSP